MVREALALLGVRRLLVGIHDAALPASPGEDAGRGAPGSAAAADFLEFVAGLGFDGLQLGPQGMTSAHDPSPYDGTCFSRDPLALALGPLASDRDGPLPSASVEALADAATVGSDRTDLERAERVVGTAIDEALAQLRAARDAGDGPAVALATALESFRETHAEWIERDGLYDALRRQYGGVGHAEWRGEGAAVDRGLFAPPGGGEEAAARRRQELRTRHAVALERHAFAQLLVHEQHRRFHERARRLGLALFGDLQVGMSDRDAWAARGFLLRGWRLGAPPSRTNPEGQPWNYRLLDPRRYRTADVEDGRGDGPAVAFLRSRVRKMLSEYDGLRIDHPHGLVCPWVYAVDGDAAAAVRGGARLFDSPDLLGLAPFAIARPDQLDGSLPRHADGWVRSLEERQVDRYATLLDVVLETAREAGLGADAIVCEVLSTLPYPLRCVMERHGLGRFRVTQKADLDRPDDVYRSENARPEDWILLGNHDTPPILAVAEGWIARGVAPRHAARLVARLAASGEDREALAARIGADPAALAQAAFAELFVGPARNVMVYFTDLFGERKPYNRPGTVSAENWSPRVPSDFRAAYEARRARGLALDLPGALARALRARGLAARHRDLVEALERSSASAAPRTAAPIGDRRLRGG